MSKKSKKSKGSKSTMWIALVLILVISNAATIYYFMFYQDTTPTDDVPLSMEDVLENQEEYFGKPITLLGYLVIAAGNHLLVSNPLLFLNNSLESSNYVILTGNIPAAINQSIGRQIAVKGTLQAGQVGGGSEFGFDSFFDITFEIDPHERYVDEKLNPYAAFNDTPHLFDPTPTKYAVLYCGGIHPDVAYYRYWNDIILMYFVLQMYGYQAENIYVIYNEGIAEDLHTPVHYPATRDSMDTVFDILSEEMGRADTLFFFTTGHGSNWGLRMWKPLDPQGDITHSQTSSYLDSINCKNMIIVMEQCKSGRFVEPLSASDRIIITACDFDEASYACDTEGPWDEFAYHFISALKGSNWNGGYVVDADYNNDGNISLREAYIYAAVSDSRQENPVYNDNGDGLRYQMAQVILGAGPWPGDSVFL